MRGESVVLAVDPGNVTGMAWGIFAHEGGHYWVKHEECDPLRAPAFAEDLRPDVIVCESFIPRPGAHTWQPDALYTIGALRYVANKIDAEFVLQSPADAKRFSTNDKLKRIGWYASSKGGHQNDALRHLLLLAIKRGWVPTEAVIDTEVNP